jgi:transcriptional repressor NrdR
MICPKCKSTNISVVDSRDYDAKTIRRRRECEDCKYRFNTYERIEAIKICVIKRSGRVEPFDREKITRGIKVSANDRIKNEEIEGIVDDIERRIIESGDQNIPTRKIGNMVIAKLKKADEIAYLRFTSVYKNFKDISSFEQELVKLKK